MKSSVAQGLLAFCLLFILTACQSESNTVPAADDASDVAEYAVQVQPLAELLQVFSQSAPAEVFSETASLSSEVSARVTRIAADVGTRVNKNDLLLEVDCADAKQQRQQAQAELDRADAQARLADTQLQRAKQLADKQSLAQQELNIRQSEADIAQANRALAQAQLAQRLRQQKNCALRAPFSGVITARNIQLGEIASGDLMTIVADQSARVRAQLTAAQAASFTTPAESNIVFVSQGQTYALDLDLVVPVIDPTLRTQEVRLQFTNNERPAVGSRGRLQWITGDALPPEYLSQRNGQRGLLWADKNTARFTVLPDAEQGQPTLIDLPAQTLVITAGRQRVLPGSTISYSKTMPSSSDL